MEIFSRKVKEKLEKFAESFDSKNWNSMEQCLADFISIDYSSFRNKPKCNISKHEYILEKKIGIGHLNTKHNFFDYQIIPCQLKAKCKCKFEIKRLEESSGKYFHTKGTYIFTLIYFKNKWRIDSIIQIVKEQIGDREIHGLLSS